MSRIIHSDGSPTTQRNRALRTLAEALHRLGTRPTPSDENKDLVALIVFTLREIAAGVEKSAEVWEKRDYYVKAERFRRDWAWIGPAERLLAAALRHGPWDEVAPTLRALRGQVADIEVTKLTREPSLWAGTAARLLAERE